MLDLQFFVDLVNEPLFILVFLAVTGAELVAHLVGYVVKNVWNSTYNWFFGN